MTENGIERAEKAVETLVYGTVGLALYVRDTAPSFIKLFVARGKNELGQQGNPVPDPLAQVKALSDLAAASAPQILRAVGDQVGRLRERAEDVIAGFATPPDAEPPPPYSPAPPPASTATSPTAPPVRPVGASAAAAAAAAASATGTAFSGTDTADSTPAPPAPAGAAPPAPGPASAAVTGLAITDYDELSASQVVDRLEGLPRHELEAIRDYERAHRARNTILGKIEQLTR